MRRQSIKESMHSSAARIVDCLGLPVCVVQCPVGKVTGLSCDFKILSSVLTGQEKKSEVCISRRPSVQGIIDLVTLNLVTTCDLVAMLQNTIFQFNRFVAKKCKKCQQFDEKCQ